MYVLTKRALRFDRPGHPNEFFTVEKSTNIPQYAPEWIQESQLFKSARMNGDIRIADENGVPQDHAETVAPPDVTAEQPETLGGHIVTEPDSVEHTPKSDEDEDTLSDQDGDDHLDEHHEGEEKPKRRGRKKAEEKDESEA